MEAPDVRDYQGPAKFVVNKRQPSFASQSRGDPGDHEEAADNRRKFSQQRIVSSRNNNTRRETRDNTDYESFNDKAVGSRGRIATKSLHSNKRLSDSGNIEPQNTKSSIKNLLDIK